MNNRIQVPFMKMLEGSAASATGELTTDSIDFKNGDRVVFHVIWGALANAQTIEVDGSNDNATWTSLKATSGGSALSIAVTTASASKITSLEFAVANYRYLRLRIPRALAGALNAVISEQFDDRVEPSTTGDALIRYVHPYAPVFLPNGSPAALSL
jgi:hypothetical protein